LQKAQPCKLTITNKGSRRDNARAKASGNASTTGKLLSLAAQAVGALAPQAAAAKATRKPVRASLRSCARLA
jgi:hypothetical protein